MERAGAWRLFCQTGKLRITVPDFIGQMHICLERRLTAERLAI